MHSRNVDFADSLKKISTEMEAYAKGLDAKANGKITLYYSFGELGLTDKEIDKTMTIADIVSYMKNNSVLYVHAASLPNVCPYPNYASSASNDVGVLTVIKFSIWRTELRFTNHHNSASFYGFYNTGFQGWRRILADGEHIIPNVTNTYNLGSPVLPWENIYTHTSPIVGSDRKIKEDIRQIDEQYIKFLMSLNPVVYKFKDDEKNQYFRMHAGFIAQEVEQALYDNGLNTIDFAGYIDSPETQQVQAVDDTDNPIFDEIEQTGENGETVKVKIPRMQTVITDSKRGLRLEEFIAPIVAVLQSQQRQIEELQKQIPAL